MAAPSPASLRESKEVKVFTFIDSSKSAATLSWEGLSFAVQPGKEQKKILTNLNGELKPGELTCILGPSGSGKTSLLNILAGRVRSGGRSKAEIGGQVKVNGKAISPPDFQQIFGYVMQDDAILGTMTPREVLEFAARLRLKAGAADNRELIQDLLVSLNLSKCSDTMVGNELIKGISGGERKRTAVGAELITNPEITFLDEPTSGLDSGAAYDLILVLKQLTMLKRSVLCTIHQPSSEIFHQFARAIFLVSGQVAYHGPPGEIRSHFSKIGLECPQDYNPADFVMFNIQTNDVEVIDKITTAWQSVGTTQSTADEEAQVPGIPSRKGFCVELVALSAREMKKTVRDKATLGARFGSTIFLTLIFGLVFFRVGSTDETESTLVERDAYDMQSHMGAVTMLGISGMFGAAQPLLLTFASERPVFMREYAGNYYGSAPYFLSKTMVELPLILLQALVQWLTAYWLMAIQGNFFVLVFSTFLISASAASTALLVACLVADAKQAMEAAPGLFVPQILFAGFFIKMELVPVFMRWLQYICSLKWGMNLILVTEFDGSPSGSLMLKANDVDPDDTWLYIVVLVAITVGFRFLAMLGLRRKARAFYN